MSSFGSQGASSASPTKSTSSAGSSSLATGPAEFYVKDYDFAIHMTKLFANEPPPTTFDVIGVFAIPIGNLKHVAKLTEKITHSIVLLLNRISGTGYLLEFTNTNSSGIVRMVPGRIVKKDIQYMGKDPYRQFNSLYGFFECNIHHDTLEDFVNKFTSLCSYHNIVHNCHVFHRSLVATAVSGQMMYNLRQDKRNITQFWNSHDWVFWEESIATRDDIMRQKPVTGKLKDLVENRMLASAIIKNMASNYNPEVHSTIVPTTMDVSIFTSDIWTSEIDVKLTHGVRTKNYISLLELLRECAVFNYMSKTVLDAMDFLFTSSNVIITSGDVGQFRKLIESSKVVFYTSVRSDIDNVRLFSIDDVRHKLGIVGNLLKAIAEKNESSLVKGIEDCKRWEVHCDALDEACECLEGLKKLTVMV